MSAAWLAEIFEGACLTWIKITKKFFRVPMENKVL
jgi:hypothetical protein